MEVRAFASWLERYRCGVIACWSVMALLLGSLAPLFVLSTTESFNPPPGSQSRRAADVIRAADPDAEASADRDSFGILLWSEGDPPPPLLSEEDEQAGNTTAIARLSFDIEASARELAGLDARVSNFAGYFQAVRDGMPNEMAQAYVGPNGTSIVLSVEIDSSIPADSMSLTGGRFAAALQQRIDAELLPHAVASGVPRSRAQLLGEPVVFVTIEQSVERDMCISDLVALPIALCVVVYVIRSARLLLLTLVSLGLSCGVAFGVMFFFAQRMAIMSATMSVMMTVLIALSLDYALFIFSRLQEAVLLRAATPLDAVTEVMRSAGQTILVSGLTLSFACLAVLVIPQDAIRGMGLGAGVAVIVVLLANLSYVPVMLLTFPRFFCPALPTDSAAPPLFFWSVAGESQAPRAPPEGPDAAGAAATTGVLAGAADEAAKAAPGATATRAEAAAQEEAAMLQSRWYRLGKAITTAPMNVVVILLVLLCTLPSARFAFDFPLAGNVDMMLDRWSPVQYACKRWLEDFGYGYGGQASTLVIVPRGDVKVLSPEFFDASRRVIDELARLPDTSCSDFAGISMVRCNEIPLDAAKGCTQAYKYGMLKAFPKRPAAPAKTGPGAPRATTPSPGARGNETIAAAAPTAPAALAATPANLTVNRSGEVVLNAGVSSDATRWLQKRVPPSVLAMRLRRPPAETSAAGVALNARRAALLLTREQRRLLESRQSRQSRQSQLSDSRSRSHLLQMRTRMQDARSAAAVDHGSPGRGVPSDGMAADVGARSLSLPGAPLAGDRAWDADAERPGLQVQVGDSGERSERLRDELLAAASSMAAGATSLRTATLLASSDETPFAAWEAPRAAAPAPMLALVSPRRQLLYRAVAAAMPQGALLEGGKGDAGSAMGSSPVPTADVGGEGGPTQGTTPSGAIALLEPTPALASQSRPGARQKEADRPKDRSSGADRGADGGAPADIDARCAWLSTFPAPLDELTRFSISLQIDPLTPQGRTWYASALARLDALAAQEAATIGALHLGGAAFEMCDNINVVDEYFPWMVLVTSVAILLLTGLAFRSAVVPLRALFTTAVTLLFCYGLVNLVYVHGVLNPLGFYGLQGDGSLFFLGPPSTFSIQCGLAIDYDMFLLVRVREYWLEGLDTREAICRGLYKSGNVISAAGVIMAVAFSGLLLSGSAAMNQLSLYLVSSVLYDTFVVRPLLVPALFSLAAATNWWPGSRCVHRTPS